MQIVSFTPKPRDLTAGRFEDLSAEYLEKHARLSRDYSTHAYNIKTLRRYFDGMTLDQIDPKAIQDMTADRLKHGVSRSTCNRQRAELSKFFNCMIDWNLYDGSNPCRRVKRFMESAGRFRSLKPDEADRLINCASVHLKPIIIAALHTGGRLGEILKLRWRDVDLDGGMVYFHQDNTKSGKLRQVPISDTLMKALRTLPHLGEDDPIFSFAGHAIGTVRTAFTTARIRADLGRDVTFHTLRHSMASFFVQRGGDLYALQMLLGHSTIGLTQRYAHLSPTYIASTVRFIGPPTQAN